MNSMNVIEKLLLRLRQLLGDRTYLGHGFVALLLWSAFSLAGYHQAAWCAPVFYYLGREERDAELKLKGTVWVKWVKALGYAFVGKDLICPVLVVVACETLKWVI